MKIVMIYLVYYSHFVRESKVNVITIITTMTIIINYSYYIVTIIIKLLYYKHNTIFRLYINLTLLQLI